VVSVGGPAGVDGGGALLAGTDEETVVTGESTAVAGPGDGEGSVAAGIDGDITDTASGTGVSGAPSPSGLVPSEGSETVAGDTGTVADGGAGTAVVVELESAASGEAVVGADGSGREGAPAGRPACSAALSADVACWTS
jgi:hypothetical protein